MVTWLEHVARWRDCTRCPLAQQRDNIVLARAGMVGGATTGGGLPCDVLVVGEAPGASEDALGQPFVGPAGDLLQQILERALPPGTTYALTNLVACFPREAKQRGDNEPELEEIEACRPRLEEFATIARPRLAILVGKLADDWVQHDAWGRVFGGVAAVDIVHPAHILARLPAVQKRYAVERAIVQVRTAYAGVVQ